MTFETYSYRIAECFVCAIEYDDRSDLLPVEERALSRFLDSLPGSGHWVWGDEPCFSRDEVTGLLADCVEATLYVTEVSHESA
jgi:hypothetical protein